MGIDRSRGRSMTLGSGIVVAAILLITAWQVDKHDAWRRLLVLAVSLGGLALLAAACTYAWSMRKASVHAAEMAARSAQIASNSKREADRIRSGALRTIAGVNLGQQRAELVYALGKPASETSNSLSWSRAGVDIVVTMGHDGRARFIACANSEYWEPGSCGSLAGLRIGSTEIDVVAALGAPMAVAFVKSMKIARYGNNSDSFDVYLAQGKVAVLAINHQGDFGVQVGTRRANELSTRFDEAFMAGAADDVAGRQDAACTNYGKALLLSVDRVAFARSLGNAGHLKESEDTQALVQRYLSENCH